MQDQENNQAPDSEEERLYSLDAEAPTVPQFEQPVGPNGVPTTQPSAQPPQPVQAPYQQYTPGAPLPAFVLDTPTPNEPKKSKAKWLVPVIALAVVLLTGGGASAYYFGVYQQPDKVLMDAFNKITAAKISQTDTVVTFDSQAGMDIVMKDIKFKTASVANDAGMVDATVSLEYKGQSVALAGKAVVSIGKNELYFQVNNLKQSLQTILEADGSESQAPDGFVDAIGKLQDQWVKVTLDDVKKNSQTIADNYQCVMDAYKKHSGNANQEIVNLYKKYPFIVVKDNMGTKDGRLGYKLGVDSGKRKGFEKEAAGIQPYKDIKACGASDSSDSSLGQETPVDMAVVDNTAYTAWFDQWTHELRRVEFSGNTDGNANAVAYNGSVDLTYDSSIKVDIPTDTISIEEFMGRVEDAMTPFTQGLAAREQTLGDELVAREMVKKAEAYNAIEANYPRLVDDFNKNSESALSDYSSLDVKVTDSFPVQAKNIGYKLCNSGGGQVAYFDSATGKVKAFGFGNGKSGTVTAFCAGATT